MEVTIIKEEKDMIEFDVEGQGHTICNAIRNELVNSENVEFAAYQIKHPQAGKARMNVTTSKGKPRKAIEDAADSLKAKIKEIRNLVKKL